MAQAEKITTEMEFLLLPIAAKKNSRTRRWHWGIFDTRAREVIAIKKDEEELTEWKKSVR